MKILYDVLVGNDYATKLTNKDIIEPYQVVY